MKYLNEKDKERCLALRNEWYSRMISNDGKFAGNDEADAKVFRDEILKQYGERNDSVLDLKCAIIFTKEEQKSGINKLHNHG